LRLRRCLSMLGFEELTSGENIPWSQAAQYEDVEG
jgi:hypothetical protein